MLSNSVKWCTLFLGIIILSASFATAQSTKTTLRVTPATLNVNPGQTTTVKIITKNATKCTITGKPYDGFEVIVNGDILLRPTETTEYVFNCSGADNVAVLAKVKVNIVPVVPGRPLRTPARTQTSAQEPVSSSSGGQDVGGEQTSQAPARRQTQYSNQSLTGAANQLCAQYSNYQSVYGAASAGSGGGSVPVDLTALAPILLSIDKNSQLTANEVRHANLFQYCTEYANMARATARIAETAARTIKTIADNCYADERCMRERVFKSSLEQEVKFAYEDPLYPRELGELIISIQNPKPIAKAIDDLEKQKYCNSMYERSFYPRECLLVPKAFDVITEKYYAARENIEIAQNDLSHAYRNSDIMGARPCVETASGRPPEEVRFYEPDCIRYRQEPSTINQEALRQITALPYTQAFSPSSVLGFDGILDNINTRTREGNLVDPNISPSFGSTNGSGGGTGGGAGEGIDLKNIEENYKKIATNIGVIVQLYDVARLAYASSTSVCKSLPVTTRREAVSRIDTNKKTYIDYLTSLKQAWDAAVARPRENHSNLIVRVNFDLKDKYNQQEIDRVYDAVRKLLQTCIDARPTS